MLRQRRPSGSGWHHLGRGPGFVGPGCLRPWIMPILPFHCLVAVTENVNDCPCAPPSTTTTEHRQSSPKTLRTFPAASAEPISYIACAVGQVIFAMCLFAPPLPSTCVKCTASNQLV